jgi:hypothetical protein
MKLCSGFSWHPNFKKGFRCIDGCGSPLTMSKFTKICGLTLVVLLVHFFATAQEEQTGSFVPA